jgi:hypothetical protein
LKCKFIPIAFGGKRRVITMTRITTDQHLRDRLLNFTQQVEICDEEGYVLGRVHAGGTSNGAARITVDAELSERLAHFGENVEICDEFGKVLAWMEACAPWSDPDQWELVEPPSPEEVQRSLKSGGRTYTTAEVLEKLRNLDVSS